MLEQRHRFYSLSHFLQNFFSQHKTHTEASMNVWTNVLSSLWERMHLHKEQAEKHWKVVMKNIEQKLHFYVRKTSNWRHQVKLNRTQNFTEMLFITIDSYIYESWNNKKKYTTGRANTHTQFWENPHRRSYSTS